MRDFSLLDYFFIGDLDISAVSFRDKTGGDRLALSGNSAGFPVMVNWSERREIRAFRAVMGLGFCNKGEFLIKCGFYAQGFVPRFI